ncbi:protein-glutamate O-methyltransferase CheR [Roseospira marina]|uniref:Chemotaxis protein methyltransferase n=2 Tax=Roseospira marina TaxID=140057 RepID=A0A5M6I7U8_9PROT|nr:protein-glutamate O-methyltransferase CheR [Roseospira marina]
METATAISADEYDRFRTYFYRKTGIRFEDSKRYFVDKRLESRIRETGHDSFRSYFMALRFEAAQTELQALTNLLTTNETYFYREDYQFRAMVRDVLPEIARHKRAGDIIRIWSLPCSTGEEPYSIALHLLEHWPGIETWDVEILASDIDTNALEKARAGCYGKRSIGFLPRPVLDRYFEAKTSDVWQISEMLRRSVNFSRANITDVNDMRGYANIDVVYCRNMLIYFDDQSRRAAVETLYGAMSPGGFIFLGHSESMSRMSGLFQVRRFADGIVYQKPRAENGG